MDAPTSQESHDDEPRVPTWFVLSEAVPFAMGSKSIVLALLGLVVSAYGAAALDRTVGLPPELWKAPKGNDAGFLEWTGLVRPWNSDGTILNYAVIAVEPFVGIVQPFAYGFSPSPGLLDRVRAFLLGYCRLFVWVCFGGAIVRGVLASYCLDRNLGAARAFGRAFGRANASMLSLTAPLLAALVLCLPGFLVGLVSRIPWIGSGIAWCLGFLPFVSAIVALYLLFDAALGFPMFVVTASTDEDAFESLSAGFSYVHSRRVGYLLLMTIGAVLGALAILVARFVFEAAAGLAGTTYLSGAGSAATAPAAYTTFASLLSLAFAHSFFWCWSSMVYLVSRREIDGVPLRTLALGPRAKTEAPPEAASEEAPADSAV